MWQKDWVSQDFWILKVNSYLIESMNAQSQDYNNICNFFSFLFFLDVDVSSPDEKSVITYVSSMYDVFPKTPEGGEGISVNVSNTGFIH